MQPSDVRARRYWIVYPGVAIAASGVVAVAFVIGWMNRHSLIGSYYCRQLRRSADWAEAQVWVAKLLKEPGSEEKLALAFQAVRDGDEQLAYWLLGVPSFGFPHIASEQSLDSVYIRQLATNIIASPDLARNYQIIALRISGSPLSFLSTVHWETSQEKATSNEDLLALAIRFSITNRDDLVSGLDAANAIEREATWFRWFENNRPYLEWDESVDRFVVDEAARALGASVAPERQIIPVQSESTRRGQAGK